MSRVALIAAAALFGVSGIAGAHGQEVGIISPESVTVTPDTAYAAGGIHRFFFGDHYRDLWATPIRVELLDLQRFAGGLTAIERGGGRQTISLRLDGANDRQYQFRSLDKYPSSLLPTALLHTLAQRILQDQISAAYPGGVLALDPLLDAAGVLHAEPKLRVIPDDPVLGEFRAVFGGMLGTIEERARGKKPDRPGFARATTVENSMELFKRVEHDQDERVDERGYLTARLVDLLVGDWDRHPGNWSWARLGHGDSLPWEPVPRDRDQAFSRFDGVLLNLARLWYPQLVEFSPTYPNMVGLTWNARVLDHRLLTGLEWPVWDSVAIALRERLTDAVIDSAVQRLPPELRAQNGAWLASALAQRRDALPQVARQFYQLLAGDVDVYGSDQGERVEIAREKGRVLEVRVYAADSSRDSVLFHRRFYGADTREVRFYLRGGDDVVRVTGTGGVGGGTPLVRVIGGGGDDRVVDSSRAGRTRFYDSKGNNTTGGTRYVQLDRRPYDEFDYSESTPDPPRDWGGLWRFQPWMSAGPDVGLFVGGGIVRYDFGFRKQPWSSRIRLRAGYATEAEAFRAELNAEFHRVNSRVQTNLFARASGIDLIRFFGFGNETPRTEPDRFYRVLQQQYLVTPSVTLPVGLDGTFTVGAAFRHVHTDRETGRLISQLRPYGAGSFTEAGGVAGLRWDRRDNSAAATRGVLAEVSGSIYPRFLDAKQTFGELHGEVATYLTPTGGFRPTLALRVGGKKVWGRFPFFESAFLGGAATVRGLREERYAGNAAVYGSAELRVRLGRIVVVLPADFGVFGLGDVGRVYLSGESSNAWHTGVGGGMWFAFLSPANTVTVALAQGDDRTALYLRAGFAY